MNAIELTTPYGAIQVVPQSDMDVYVTEGELDFGTFRVRVTGHVERPTPTSLWDSRGRYGVKAKRTDSSRETTARMDEKVAIVVEQAIAAIGEDVLAATQAAKRLEQARARDDVADALIDLVQRLRRESDALRAGGREEYHDHHHATGFTETGIRHVRTRDGILLPSLPEVKVYASHKYGPRLPD